MKVRCVSNFINEETRARFSAEGLHEGGSIDLNPWLTIGREYVVVALLSMFAREPENIGPYVVIVPDVGALVNFPLSLFQITDPRMSRFWELRVTVDTEAGATDVTLGPPSVVQDFNGYIERLVNGEPSTHEDFARAIAELNAEASGRS